MNYLGIDFGMSKIGLAHSEGILAEPLEVYRYDELHYALSRVEDIVKKREISQIIIGISEGEMEPETKKFGKMIKTRTGITPIYVDETLSTIEAQMLSIDANIHRKKRKDMEDAYAATLILQSYLDSLEAK